MDRAEVAAVKVVSAERGRHFLEHAEAEILERRHRVGQRQNALVLVNLEPKEALRVAFEAIEARVAQFGVAGFVSGEAAQAADVARGLGGAVGGAVSGGKAVREARGKRGGARGVLTACRQFAFDGLAPPAQQREDRLLDALFVRGAGVFAVVEHVAQQREVAAFHLEAPVECLGPGPLFEQFLDSQTDLRRKQVARQPDEGEEVAAERRLDQNQARARPVDKAHHRGGDALDVALGKPDQEVVRQRGQRMDERLARMAVGVEPELGIQVGKMGAQARHLRRRGAERGAGPDARMDRQRRHLAAFDHRHDEQVERYPAMDVGHPVRLDDQRCAGAAVGRIVEPGEGAVVARIGQDRPRALAANAENRRVRSVAVAGQMPQLGQHPAFQPAKQRAAFAVAEAAGILEHCFAQLGPVGDRGAHVGKRRAQVRLELAALTCIGPRGFDVDQRFACAAPIAEPGDRAACRIDDQDVVMPKLIQPPNDRTPDKPRSACYDYLHRHS